MRSRRLWLVLLFCVPVLLAADEKVRRPWYVGLGLGTFFDAAWVVDGHEVKWEDLFEGTRPNGWNAYFGVEAGATLSPAMLLGVDLNAILKAGDVFELASHTSISTQIRNIFAMFTLFPWRQGLFVRLGGGYSNVLLQIISETTYRETANGCGLLAGVGYAFWLGRHLNISLNAEHSRQFYFGDEGPDTSRFTGVYIGFDWY